MAKKSITKSKSAPKQLLKKYQFAGANQSTYNQVANPYYISGTYAEQAGQEADRYYGNINRFGDYAQAQNIDAEVARKNREAEEKRAQKEMVAQGRAQKEQEVAAFGQQVAKAAGDEALSYGKIKLAERAARKAAEKTATNALATAGNTVASSITPAATNTVAQGIAPTITAQAARGSGMEAARVASNFIDETGAVALPQAGMTSAAGTGAGVGGAAAASGASTAANTGLMAANMSGLASAGIGLGLTGAGMLVQRKMDTDPNKYSKKEGRQNAWGDALKSAGTGFGMGATAGTIVPGVGNVVGGIVGGIAGLGAGLIKGVKENRRMQADAGEYASEKAKMDAEIAEAERVRKAELEKQGNLLAQRYNTAFVNSRLTGAQTGFGYNTSTNMNMQPTSSYYAETGGVRVPGGQVVPINGSDAVKFVGKKHSEGGIKLDAKTEVEGGETMDKVMMNGGKPNDYFFSSYLKLGGKSFAKRHEEILKAGGSQKSIQDLAKKQEAIANKKGEKDRSPQQIASYGGIHKYQTGNFYKENVVENEEETKIDQIDFTPVQEADGNFVVKDASGNVLGKSMDRNVAVKKARGTYSQPALTSPTTQQSADAQSNANANDVTVRDTNKANAEAPKDQSPVAPGGTTNNAGQAAADAAVNVGTRDSSATSTSSAGAPVTGDPKKERYYNREDITKGSKGVSKSMEKVPTGQGDQGTYFGKVSNAQFTAFQSNNPWFDFSAGFDPKKRDFTSAKGVKGSSDVAKFQEEYNKYVGEGNRLQVDGKLGEQTATAMLMFSDPAVEVPPADNTPPQTPPQDGTPPKEEEKKKEEEQKQVADLKRGVNGSLLAGLGQLIPVGYALARPYKTEGNLPRMAGGGNVGAGSVRGAILPRVNMNAERAAAERNTVAIKNAIQNTNAGPGGIAAMMAANSSQNNQNLTIANQEQEANKQLAAEEARLGQQASQFNAETAQRANMANVQNRLAVNQANLEAGIQESRLKIDEKRYKREEILGALDTASSRIAGIVKDEKSYKAQERLAKAIDNTGSYDRFTILEQLQKESKNKNSPYYGKTDVELKKIATDTYNEVIGKMGLEGEQNAKNGGRRYTSRLGDLSRGRNKRNFNI